MSVWTPITARLELRGEAFVGEALAGLGGGGIGQNMVRNGVAVGSRGGWIQLNVKPSEALEVGGGGGIDDPDDEDLGATSRLRNTAVEGHVTWRPRPAVLGLEARGIRTRYPAPAGTQSATQEFGDWARVLGRCHPTSFHAFRSSFRVFL